MKVLYDISILGIGNVNQKAKTGVFRVVENVANFLVDEPNCAITFCSNLDIYSVSNSYDYLKQNTRFSAISFAFPDHFDKRNQLAKKRSAIIRKHSEEQIPSLEKLIDKVKLKEMWLREKLLLGNGLISKADLGEADIFHSPFFAIKDNIKNSGVKSFFLTVYDLIPVIHPQFFEQGIINSINEMLNSITYETWILCISESTKNDLLNYMGKRVNADRVLVTELAASSLFYPSTDKKYNECVRKKYNIPNAPYILSLCTLEPRKNIDKAIRAFANMVQQENIKDLNLVLVGTKGWDFDKIFEEIDSLKSLKNRIIVTGFINDADLAAIYSDAVMFVYPSYYEGFGLPPLEAMQCGVPVVTSNTSSLPEVVGNAGIMVSPDDIDALSNSMLKIYYDDELRSKMSAQSIERSTIFSWQRCAKETALAYSISIK